MRTFPLTALLASTLAGAPFQSVVEPVLRQKCLMCHNDKTASGNLNLAGLMTPASLAAQRDTWEKIVAKIRTGEMPPKGVPKPPAEVVSALVEHVEAEFEKADKAMPANPGRVTARRLNRVEYSNTVRDLLGVHFRANEEFPPDDSGYGFDNISDVLTVSPTLMQRYVIAAEKIAARAIGADPLPKPGLFDRRSRVQRKGAGVMELNDIIEFPADYVIRAKFIGHRGVDGKPVLTRISIDGKPVKEVEVPTAFTLVNRQGGATQRTQEEVRVFLNDGPHRFRVEFVNDEAGKSIPPGPGPGRNNIVPDSFEIAGPFPPAEELAERKQVVICDPAAGAACVEKIMAPLVKKAYRRSISKSEVLPFVKVSENARAAGYNPGQALQFSIAALLVSPHFLFRIEKDPAAGQVKRISDIELANRLSYFLWSSMPDGELMALAEKEKLHEKAVLTAQLARMLNDGKSSALAENFAGQWLETRSLDAAKPDPVKFPAWNADLKEAMKTETQMFFEEVMRKNLPISDFLDGKYSFLNEQLAKHYGIEGITGGEFRRVELDSPQRSGVLTHASVLTVSSYPSRTSPVLRGKYLLENILGAAPPAPPADVPALDEAAIGKKGTLRQQFEQHRADPSCASCHARMDVLGFALENYDATGKWRTKDGEFPVDPAGTFPNGKSFATPAEMKMLLKADMPEFTRCLTEKLMTYALGRGVERFDRRVVQQIARQTEADGYRMQTLIGGIVNSMPFQARRGEALRQATKETKAK